MRHARSWRGHGARARRGFLRYRGGCGPGFGSPFRRFDRETWLESLEEYQRDLEQELADVSDLIKRLREEPAPTGSEPATHV